MKYQLKPHVSAKAKQYILCMPQKIPATQPLLKVHSRPVYLTNSSLRSIIETVLRETYYFPIYICTPTKTQQTTRYFDLAHKLLRFSTPKAHSIHLAVLYY